MNEETAYTSNWKEEVIAEYARLEKKINKFISLKNSDPEINRLALERDKLNKKIVEMGKQSILNIDAAQQQQAGIKLELAEKWDIEDKTFECAAGTATLRTTKSLHIRSKEKLVAFLELNKKLTEFIKNFEITKLRKIKEAGMLEDEIATWDEKKNVAIKIAEEKQ